MTNINSDDVQFVLAKQRNFKITLGSIFGIMLCIYFFSFASLIDKAPPAFFDFELVTGIAMAIMLFMLNKISFAYIKGRFGKKSGYQPWIKKLHRDDVDKKIEAVMQELAQR